MAVSGIEVIFGVSIFWIVIILLPKRIDMESRGFLIAPGFLIWRSIKIDKFFSKIKSQRLNRFGNFTLFFTIALFLVFPFVLFINIILYFLKLNSPLFDPNPIISLNFEFVLLLIIPLILTLLIHEFSRAIMIKSLDGEIQYGGFALIVILITLFIKQTTESFTKFNKKSRLKVISFALIMNLIFFLICLVLQTPVLNFTNSFYGKNDGALITSVNLNGPADKVGLVRGDVIKAIKLLTYGQVTQVYNITSASDLISNLRNIQAGIKFVISTINQDFVLQGNTPGKNSIYLNGSDIGINFFTYKPPKITWMSPFIPYWMKSEIEWLINLNLVFSLFNLLPLPITDGSRILKEVFESELTKRKINIIYFITFLILGTNLLLSYFV